MNLAALSAARWRARAESWRQRSRRPGLGRKLAAVLSVAAVASGIATFAALTGSPPAGRDPATILILLNLDLVLFLLVGTLVAREAVKVWAERRRGIAGSRLHVRLVLLFSLVAVAPTIVMAVFTGVLFNVGLQGWFSDKVRIALRESLAASEAYLDEHQQDIRMETAAMAIDLNRELPRLRTSRPELDAYVSQQVVLRDLSEAIIFDPTGRYLVNAGPRRRPEPTGMKMPAWAIEAAREGKVAIMVSGDEPGRLRALVRLSQPSELFLYVSRPVQPAVVRHIERVQRAVSQYEELEQGRLGLQITSAGIFVLVALLILMAAALVGLGFANQIARPLSRLVFAAERVGAGDLSVRVPESRHDDEVGSLSRAFNRMTSELETHRQELMEANRQLDSRRRFTETVLTGVSAGVIGLDPAGLVNLPNRSASALLALDLGARTGEPLAAVVPEMAPLIARIRAEPARSLQSQIKIDRGGDRRTLLVRIVADTQDDAVRGFVVTFDDVTELLSAQRKAAWSDVARRIAHEIKNPLTPIQLSAERLKRKYLRQIRTDPETFAICTDTIVKQVGDIGRMVDEFSAFARMPSPALKPENLSEIASEAVFLQRNAHPAIKFALDLPAEPVRLGCDRRQVGQAITNLLQNAVDSIAQRVVRDGEGAAPGRVRLALVEAEATTSIVVEDNGTGLPAENRDRLTEPYVTTRAGGTGLGLAIVRKIMEDHGGDLRLADREEGGARVSMIFHHRAAREDGAPAGEGAADHVA